MGVPGRMIRVQNVSFDICRTKMKHARFMVINPYNGMIVMLAHGNLSFSGEVPGDSVWHGNRGPDTPTVGLTRHKRRSCKATNAL